VDSHKSKKKIRMSNFHRQYNKHYTKIPMIKLTFRIVNLHKIKKSKKPILSPIFK